MQVYDLSKSNMDFMEVPLCPLCDQPIVRGDLFAIGEYEVGDCSSVCLIHDHCGEEISS